jgi:guanylate kinase
MILPPSFEVWRRRLASRGAMRPDEVRRRLETAKKIFEDGLNQNYYHFVVSDNIDQSTAIIDAITEDKANPHQGRGRSVIEHLKSELEDELSTIR